MHLRSPLHQTPYISFRQQLFLCFFFSLFFKPNDSIPYCAYIWACSRGIPLIFGVVLPNFVYFYCFGGWKTNQCRKKNIVFVAFLWSVSLWASLNFSAYGFKTKWSFQNTYFCKIGKSCHDQNFFSMSAGWISDHMVGIPPTSIETSQDGWNSNHLQLINWPFLFIGPESDHWECLSVTDWLTN